MKKVMKRKLMLDRDVVKVLVMEVRDARLQYVRGGAVNSFLSDCTIKCATIDVDTVF